MDKINRIRVMARSSPFNKLLMVQCLKQKGNVVPITVMLPCLIKAMNNKDSCIALESKCSVEYESSIDHRISYAHGSGLWGAQRLFFDTTEEEMINRSGQSRPTAAKWRVNSIKHYDLMVELWAADRATSSGVRTARQGRRQRVGPRVSVDLNQNIEYTPEQPDWTRYSDPTPPFPPPSVDEYSPGQTQSVPSVPSGGTSSSRGSKRKAPMVDVIDSQFDKLTTSLDGFAGVLSSSNVHFGVISDAVVRQVTAMEDRNQILCLNSNYTYTEADIYEMLSAMNIADENWLEQCYDFLCGNPTCTKRLMGLPPHKRTFDMASSSTKRPRKSRKGKETLTEAQDAAHVRPSVQEQLDQSRFFTHSLQMENYAADFYTRKEDQTDHHEYPVQPPPPPANPNIITQMWQGVQDLQHRMQGMEQMQVRVQHIEDNLANLSLDMNRQFANLNHNVNKILHHFDD
ncbi:hypothetical protein LR48_Vigan07g208700 [Vigna angularis]|uniref:Uncharacterized protein n=1 Tax=Phaseolus angularis TaxID=3914 RepID=A0A0L9V020_PHAAN|nr:hypothetical protein LR48_Vigan07g208700 [Vigna angularis]